MLAVLSGNDRTGFMGSIAGKVFFAITALVVVGICVALNADPHLFAGKEKAVFLLMTVIAITGMSAYFVGVTTRTMVLSLGLIAGSVAIYAVYTGSGDPLALFHRLAAGY
jgi:Na+-transporting NADH:ubiquinone oxidoreductase subunit NqrD